MASFQAKLGWKRLKMRENKNYRFVSFLHDALPILIENNKKIGKKILKTKKYNSVFFSSQNRLEKAEKERKQKLSFRFDPTRRVIENCKKNEKFFKKYHYGFNSSQNRMEKAEKERK